MTKSNSKNSQASLPLTPNKIPITKIPNNEATIPSAQARTVRNPLGFVPTNQFTKFFALPGIFIFCIFAGYLLGRLRFNFIFLFPIGHIAYYYFNRRVKEYTRSLEVIKKQEQIKESLGEFETVEWMNYIIQKTWDVSEQTVSSIIFNEVNNTLKKLASKPGLSIRLAEITLGTRPPVIEKISFLKESKDAIVIEFSTYFIPIQASDDLLTYFKGNKTHWNTYIELQVILANFVTIPILVKNFTFTGFFKVTLDLTRKIPFIKEVSLSFMEMPLIDFQLFPLKSIDMLDLPYVGNLLNMILESQIKKLLLHPNKITIDLEEITKYSGAMIGVVYVYIHDLQSEEQSTYWATLKNNGKKFGTSDKKVGSDPVFNQGFYDIIYDTTQFIEMQLLSSGCGSPLNGRICLRNLNKFLYNEKLTLSGLNSRKVMNVTTQFYSITDSLCESVIISLNVISIEDLQAYGDPNNKLYSTYCKISLETREAVISRSVIKAMETKRIFVTKDPFYNETFSFFIRQFDEYIIKILVMDEKEDKEIGRVVIPCVDIKSNATVKSKISGVESGELHFKSRFKYVNMNDPGFTEEDTTPLIKEIPQPQVITQAPQVNETKDPYFGGYIDDNAYVKLDGNNEIQEELPNLSIGIYNYVEPSQRFIRYTKAYQFTVVSIKSFGIFYCVFETDNVNIKMDPFSTDVKANRSVIVPIENESYIKVRLFKFSLNGDVLISEESVSLDDNVVVFDKIRVEFTIEKSDLTDYNGEQQEDENAKVLQVRIGDINRTGTFTYDFYNDIFQQNTKLTHRLNTFVMGKEPLYCMIKDKGKVVVNSEIPKRNCKEDFDFGKNLVAPLFCKAQVCSFKYTPAYRKGELEVYLLKVSKLTKPANGSYDAYVKIFINGEKIHKTQSKSKTLDPIFNESLKIKVNRDTDTIGFHVFTVNSLSIDPLINHLDFPLLNIPNGYSRFNVPMNDGVTGEKTDTEVHLICSFVPELNKAGKI